MTTLRVSAFQGKAIYGNVKKTLKIIKEFIEQAENEKIDILCFPECYLQGYILNEMKARELSIDLDSQDFFDILKILNSKTTTIIFGLIEREGENIYNTAVVVEQGKLIGTYRKQHLLKKENFFSNGVKTPVFKKKGIKFGINICYDTRYSNSVLEMAGKGAKLLFFPINNSLHHEVAYKWKDKHVDYWIKHAKETSCWVVTADVVEESESNTGFGFTTIIDPKGNIVKSVEHFKQGMLTEYVVEF